MNANPQLFRTKKKMLAVLASGNMTVSCKTLCKSSYSKYVQHWHCGFKCEINLSIASLVEDWKSDC